MRAGPAAERRGRQSVTFTSLGLALPATLPVALRLARRSVLGLTLGLMLAACGGDDDGRGGADGSGPGVANATVTGPIGDAGLRGHALWDSWFDLADLGYDEEEYFISGTAQADDGGAPAPYTTRIIVRRPQDPAHFNGTVLLDWVNVTAQFENAVDTLESHQLFHRDGYAYVHVSAQAAGLCCLPALTPKTWDPERYADIDHPGDAYAFDIFSQIAKALKQPRGVDAMNGLPVRAVLAMGQSQSASRLYRYVTTVQARAGVIDGFLIHSGGGKTYDPAPSVPVIQLFSEAEADPAPLADVKNYRGWEIAGAAHQNAWVGLHQVVGQAGRAVASAPKLPASADELLHDLTANYGEQVSPESLVCIVAGTQFPMRYAVNAAIHHLDRWVKTGTAPPQGPRYEFSGDSLARDGDGNGRGGIRYPVMDVPVARYASDLCGLGGITLPFNELQLLMRYPTFNDYRCRMQAATQQSVMQGFLLPHDAAELLSRVEGARNRWLVAGGNECGS